jgi:hypothetical protein
LVISTLRLIDAPLAGRSIVVAGERPEKVWAPPAFGLVASGPRDYDETVTHSLARWSSKEAVKRGWLAAVVAAFAAASCSRSITSSTSLLDPEWPRSANPTMRITGGGVNPDILHLDAPVTVTVTNEDAAAHRLDPAPELGYGNCTEIEQIGTLQPGQSGRLTIGRGGVICAFHDSAAPANQSFQGFIVVH